MPFVTRTPIATSADPDDRGPGSYSTRTPTPSR